VQLYSDAVDEDHFLGDVRVRWKKALDSVGQWAVNNRFKVGNTSYIKEQSKMKIVSGNVGVQVKFLESQEKSEMAIMPQSPKFIGTIVEEGVLELTLVQCILTPENRSSANSRFYCDIEFMDVEGSELLGKRSARDDVYWDTKLV
jgi:hypothetical protein